MTAKKSLAFIVIINAFNADNEGRKETTLSEKTENMVLLSV